MITQRELTKIKELQLLQKDIKEELDELRSNICEKFYDLQEEVETGLFKVEPVKGQRRPAWKKYVERLAGAGYVKNVIAHTKPGPPSIRVR